MSPVTPISSATSSGRLSFDDTQAHDLAAALAQRRRPRRGARAQAGQAREPVDRGELARLGLGHDQPEASQRAVVGATGRAKPRELAVGHGVQPGDGLAGRAQPAGGEMRLRDRLRPQREARLDLERAAHGEDEQDDGVLFERLLQRAHRQRADAASESAHTP